MINPAAILTIKKQWHEFSGRHPKFVAFLHTIKSKGLAENTVIDLKVTLPNGEVYQSNLKLTAEDVEAIKNFVGSQS